MDYQSYLDEKRLQLKIVCRAQWDYLNYSDLCVWLEDNFGDDAEGKYYAIKILLHTVYYKKKDLERLLLYGLNEKIYGEIIKEELVEKSNIYISNSEAAARVNKLRAASFFIPLLDSSKPSESGNSVIGDLVHKCYISEKQVDFHWNVNEEKLKDIKILIFVDDCVGSGSQLKKFWNSQAIQNLKNICKTTSTKIFYMVLVGYDKNLQKLKDLNQLEGIEIIVCDVLNEKNRVFSDENIIWDKSTNEKSMAINYFQKLKKERGINFYGYKKLDFAIILHDRLPNWSLPLFWKEMAGWKNLMKRKSSNK